MSVNSRHPAIKVICQRKAFYRQRITEPSCVRKGTVEIDVIITSRNGDRKDLSWLHFGDEPICSLVYQNIALDVRALGA